MTNIILAIVLALTPIASAPTPLQLVKCGGDAHCEWTNPHITPYE